MNCSTSLLYSNGSTFLSFAANNSSDQTKDQDLLSHLLRSLAGLAGIVNEKNLTGLLPGSQDLQNAGTSDGNPAKVSNLVLQNAEFFPVPVHF